MKNTPAQLGDAIVNAGFKLLLHATTRAYSLKGKGIIDTLNFHSEVHPLRIASTLEETQNDYYIFSKNNIKIAIINYSGFVENQFQQKINLW